MLSQINPSVLLLTIKTLMKLRSGAEGRLKGIESDSAKRLLQLLELLAIVGLLHPSPKKFRCDV